MAPASAAADRPIQRADIEAKFRELTGGVRDTAAAAAPIGLAIGAAAVVAVIGIAFLFGKRRGRKRSTVVEIRRI
jgi:hypothetical protein